MAVSNEVLERWNRRRPGSRSIVNRVPNQVVNAAVRTPRARANAARAVRSQGRGNRARTGGARGFLSSPSRQQAAANYAYDSLVNSFQETANRQATLDRVVQEGGDTGGGGFAESPVGRALDIISRPAYGLFEGLESLAEQETHQGYNWDDLRYSIGNFFTGFARGAKGEEKTGFGQVYESYKDNPEFSAAQYLRNFEEAHPALEQNVARGIGFAGELGLDPVDWFIPTPQNIIRNTGEAATREAIEGTVKTAARSGVDDVVQNSSFLARSRYFLGRPDALAGRVDAGMDDALNSVMLEVLG